MNWEPQIPLREDQIAAEGAFGWLPVILGTIVITFVALVVAVPVGLFSAIYLNEFAPKRLRSYVKPMLEILAGVPTVVYGFFLQFWWWPRPSEVLGSRSGWMWPPIRRWRRAVSWGSC